MATTLISLPTVHARQCALIGQEVKQGCNRFRRPEVLSTCCTNRGTAAQMSLGTRSGFSRSSSVRSSRKEITFTAADLQRGMEKYMETDTETTESATNADEESTTPENDASVAEDVMPEVVDESPAAVIETPVPEEEVPKSESDDELIQRNKIDALKQVLTLLGAVTNRGQFASESQKGEALKALTALEGLCVVTSHEEIMQQQQGRWTLMLSDVEPFRVSPFFMALEEALLDYPDRDESRPDRVFGQHRLATSVGEFGSVAQTILGNELKSEVELRVGVLPGLPFAITGTVVSRGAVYSVGSNGAFTVEMLDTSVTNSNAASFLDDWIKVPVGEVYRQLGGDVPKATLTTTYVDEDLRVCRSRGGHYFVFS
eukprot:CAMPEP_0118956696 /NCGR_PEP_ID=MMETSP1169-20130426/61716_1 /TAXON_ID=36882 /ORGANISM="Pyramimonas obovata, Strain CCMP722" /LENGTH=371 /DNA_ID=CAMNT_0006904741 /DNA_START=1890 /DNA_END=3002 /DNA_ORIENTATION=+